MSFIMPPLPYSPYMLARDDFDGTRVSLETGYTEEHLYAACHDAYESGKRAALASQAAQPSAQPVARLLHWIGPEPRPDTDTIARTFNEYPVSLAAEHSYWQEGALLYTTKQQ